MRWKYTKGIALHYTHNLQSVHLGLEETRELVEPHRNIRRTCRNPAMLNLHKSIYNQRTDS